MSILRQLKEEVASKQKTELSESQAEKQRDLLYQQRLLPRMQTILGYMKELVDHLNYLDHTVSVVNYSARYPQIGRLQQREYSLYTDEFCGFDDINQLRHINIHFLCIAEGVYNYSIRSQRLIEQEIHFLSARNIKFHWECIDHQAGIKTAQFTITPKIPVRFRFEADLDNAKIQLLIDNHEDFDSYKHEFAPEEIDEKLLNEVAKLMLRERSSLSGPSIPDAHREAIQKMLAEKRREESIADAWRNNPDGQSDDKSPIRKLALLFKSLRWQRD